MEEILKYYQELHDSLGTENLCEEFYQKVFQIIQSLVDKIPEGARVGIRSLGEHTSWLIKTVQMSHINVVGIFDKAISCHEIYGIPCYLDQELQSASLDYVIISNFFHLNEIREELSRSESKIIDFYAELEKQGIKLRGPFYMYNPDSPLTLGHFYWNYVNNNCEDTLRKFLQAALEQKDFIMIDRVYKENGGISGKYPVLIEVWDKTQKLLELLREKIQEREQKDILMFWTDAIAYYDLDCMPETKKRGMEQGCFFQRTYTCTPYTESTFQAIFRGVLPIDDYPAMEQSVNRSNSPLLKLMEEHGYNVSCFLSIDSSIIQTDYQTEESYASNTVIWWNAIQYILHQDRPCFCLLHFLSESHTPVMYPAQPQVYTDLTYQGQSVAKEQRDLSLQYLDCCLSLYDWLLGEKTQILLSDHGSFVNDQPAWSDARLHAYCFVKGKGIPNRKVLKIFSYKKFADLIHWLVDPQKVDFSTVESDEAFFQDTDFYSRVGIHQHIARGTPRQGLAYRGILTDQYKYVINSLGEEFFYVYENGAEIQVPLENEALRAELRAKCGAHFLDIRKIEKFKYSGELYKAIRELDPDCGQPLWLTGEE